MSWTPQSSAVTNHALQCVAENTIFFAPPPAEIGTVLTADSSLKTTTKAKTLPVRVSLALLGFAGVSSVLLLLLSRSPLHNIIDLTPLAIFPGACAGIAVLWVTRFSHLTTYVGTLGVAQIRLSGSLSASPSTSTLLFAEASHLFTKAVITTVNGVYSGTMYRYRWADEKGRTRLHLVGSHNAKNGVPRSGDQWHFATSSERAWTAWLKSDANPRRENSLTEFPVAWSRQKIRINGTTIQFMRGAALRGTIEIDNLLELYIEHGSVYFIPRGGGRRFWQRRYVFPHMYIGNARLLLDRLAENGVRICSRSS